jgi:hypothetical protein
MSEKVRITKTVVAAGCALTLSALLGACASSTSSAATPRTGAATITGTAPIPGATPGTGTGTTTGSGSSTTSTTGTTSASSAPATPSGPNAAPSTPSTPPAPAGAPTGTASELLRPDQLPDARTYGWTSKGVTEVNVEHPLPDLCGNSLGTQVTHGVWEADFGAHDNTAFAAEDIYVFASPADAAAQMAASRPKCPGTTVSSATSFAWSGSGRSGASHVLFTNWNNVIAALVINPGRNDYNPSIDAQLLTTMTQRLENP